MSKTDFTDAEQALLDHLLQTAGWLDDYEDAERKYDSLSSGERYVMDVLRETNDMTDPERVVDHEYATLVKAVLEERGQA